MKMLDQIDNRDSKLTDWEKHMRDKLDNEPATAEELRLAIHTEYELGRAATQRGDKLAAREHHGRAAHYATRLRSMMECCQ